MWSNCNHHILVYDAMRNKNKYTQIMYCFYAFNDISSDNYAVFAFFYKLYNNNRNINEK